MFSALAKATAEGVNAFGISMSTSATATATGTSEEDAQSKATKTAQDVAEQVLNTNISSSDQVMGATLSLMATSVNIGKSWVQITSVPASPWKSVASSASGMDQVATDSNYIYLSADYGETWLVSTILTGCSVVSMSASGKYVSVIASKYIYTSDDSGQTFIQVTNPGNQTWSSLSISASGQYQSAAVEFSGYLYRSDNYGKTWTANEYPGVADWKSIAVSSSGKYQTAGKYQPDQGGSPLYVSSDHGASWAEVPNTLSELWSAISISASGRFQLVGNRDNKLFRSNDHGKTFTATEGTQELQLWASSSISAWGKFQIAVPLVGNIYMSYNFGETWSQVTDDVDGIPGNRGWNSASMSASGQYITTGADDYLYTSTANTCCN